MLLFKDLQTSNLIVSHCYIMTTHAKRPLSKSSSLSSPEYKRANINLLFDSFETDLEDFENKLLNESPSPTAFIDRNYEKLIEDTILSERISSFIVSMIKSEVQKQTAHYEERISYLTGCVDSLSTMVTELRNEIDCQQQYSRRTSLRIVNDWKEQRGEDTDDLVVDMIQNQLNMNIDKKDIDRSHRVGKPHPRGRPRPVIVRFVSYRTKRSIYKARSALQIRAPRGKAKAIHEDLTKTRLKMYREAQSLKSDNLVQDCWTVDGNVFVRNMRAQVKMFDNPDKLSIWSSQLRQNPPKSYSDVPINDMG